MKPPQPPHQQFIDRMNAFEMADRNTPRDKLGRASFGMGANDMPRTAAQQASVKKAALKSAQTRGARAAGKEVLKPAPKLVGKKVPTVIKKGLLGL